MRSSIPLLVERLTQVSVNAIPQNYCKKWPDETKSQYMHSKASGKGKCGFQHLTTLLIRFGRLSTYVKRNPIIGRKNKQYAMWEPLSRSMPTATCRLYHSERGLTPSFEAERSTYARFNVCPTFTMTVMPKRSISFSDAV